jgi:hypothetical protein
MTKQELMEAYKLQEESLMKKNNASSVVCVPNNIPVKNKILVFIHT